MSKNMWKHMLIVAVIGCAVGCGGSSSAESDSGDGGSPKQVARDNARLAQESLRESDKGVNDSGERVWKQEARAFFDFDRNPANKTFELDPAWARQFTEIAYSAGAPNVWVTSISQFELGGESFNIADSIVIELPKAAASRGTILNAYNAELKECGLTPLADIGQDYLFVAGD